MLKFAGAVFDCYDDPAFMTDLRAQGLLGKELKTADELLKLGEANFAVKIIHKNKDHRKYPIYDELVTKLSCAYFLSNEDNLPEDLCKIAGYRLARACRKYHLEVPTELAKYAKHDAYVYAWQEPKAEEPAMDEQATAEALVFKVACEFPKMTPEDRVMAAGDLNNAGLAHMNRQIWDYVPKDEYGPLFEKSIKERDMLVKSAELGTITSTALQSIAAQAKDIKPIEMAVKLREFDKYAGFSERYKHGLTDPFKACFGGFRVTEAEKEEKLEPKDAEGNVLTKEASDKMNVAEHVALLQKHYPKHSKEFKKHAHDLGYVADSMFAAAVNVYFKND